MGQARLVSAALCALALSFPALSHAASFDCSRARAKLSRIICSDAQLSTLDEEVWNAYGTRIKTLAPLQQLRVRQRHLQWRRTRGHYDDSVAALSHDYRIHLSWLTHPLLPLEGRYERGDNALTLDLVANPAQIALSGITLQFGRTMLWRATAQARDGRIDAQPEVMNGPVLDAQCVLRIEVEDGALAIDASRACGPGFDGRYLLSLAP
jgi:uncharacterized protein YecT (DUF1311 family)